MGPWKRLLIVCFFKGPRFLSLSWKLCRATVERNATLKASWIKYTWKASFWSAEHICSYLQLKATLPPRCSLPSHAALVTELKAFPLPSDLILGITEIPSWKSNFCTRLAMNILNLSHQRNSCRMAWRLCFFLKWSVWADLLNPCVILLTLIRVHTAVVVWKNQMLLLCCEG